MPRSLIPAGMALLAAPMLPGVKFLFDGDGLMADERADFAGWSRRGPSYRILRAIESAAVRRADVVVTRTNRAAHILAERSGPGVGAKIFVVSNGKDASLFHPGDVFDRAATRHELGLSEETPLLVYGGSLGPQYHPERMAAFCAAVQSRQSDAHFLILTGSPEVARAAVLAGGLRSGGFTVRRVPADAVPRYLAASDLGLAFRTPSLSQEAVAPIKVGEYLLCGLPVLSSAGIGDLDDQLDATTGRLVHTLDDAVLEGAAAWFTDQVLSSRAEYRAACRQRGLEHFSLERSVVQYKRAFERLAVVA